ncbi:MAG: CREG family protein [Gallionella sp.]|nr:CREG family protein [Gallionella sp.]
MDSSRTHTLKSLLETQQIASLGTLHKGEPAVSMVPFALLPHGQGLVIHVSQLATHTKDMLANPAVSLLVIASPASDIPAQALPRVSIQGRARQCLGTAAEYPEARHTYLSRFPQSEAMFGFADFSLFVIEVRSARLIGGFAQATSITAADFAATMGAKA